MEADKKNRKIALNIIPTEKKNKHRGFGHGMIDLSNLSSIIIDGENEAYIDIGALHAKSKVERGIRFSDKKEDVPNGRQCFVVWVAVDRNEEGQFYYAGVTACEMWIDSEARKGWKILADHVNLMDRALKRRIILDGLSDKQKKLLREVLQSHKPEWWAASSELQAALDTGAGAE